MSATAILDHVLRVDEAIHRQYTGVAQYAREWVPGEWAALRAMGQAGFEDARVNERDCLVSVLWKGPHPLRAAIHRTGPDRGKALRDPCVIW